MLPARLVRRLDAVALVGGIAAALVLGGAAAPVAVASAHVLVSADGIHFSPTLAGGLFDGRRMLVPGHSVSAELWVRSPTQAPAALRVSAMSDGFGDGVTMSAWDSGTDETTSAPLGALARCRVLMSSQWVAPGETIKMVVTFTMAHLAAVTAQQESARLGLVVDMRDAEAGPFLAGVGVFFVAGRRRREHDEP